MAEIIRINENTWRIEDGGVRFFLLEGSRSALLIDSGMNTPDARALAESITQKPLALLNTHADRDHTSGNDAFDTCYMHPAEWEHSGMKGSYTPVSEGSEIDLGDRVLHIFDLPGHTPGSIAILDAASRVLIGGDAIQSGRIFMFGPGRDLNKYILSLEALLEKHGGEFDTVYPSHADFPVGAGIILQLIDAAKTVAAGKAQGKETDFMGRKIICYDFPMAGFLCDC